MAEVVLEGVTKVYPGDVKAVDNIDLTITDREFMVLVGPSGCGKSTTLRMVAGLEDITAGTIRIGGRVVNDIAPKDRDIAMVFQNYALYPHMSVYKNMAFGLMLRRQYAGWGNPLGWMLSRERHRQARDELHHLLHPVGAFFEALFGPFYPFCAVPISGLLGEAGRFRGFLRLWADGDTILGLSYLRQLSPLHLFIGPGGVGSFGHIAYAVHANHCSLSLASSWTSMSMTRQKIYRHATAGTLGED